MTHRLVAATRNPKDPKPNTWSRTKRSDDGWTRLERPVDGRLGERLEKYLAPGTEEAGAEERARWKTTPEIKAKFFDDYETHLWEYKTVEFNDVHRDVLDTLEQRLSDGVDIHHAIKRAVAKHKPEFEGLFQELDEDSEEDEDPAEEEEEDPDPSLRMA